MVAAMRGHTASVLALAARGAALDAKDAGGMTVLQWADESADEESTSPPATRTRGSPSCP
jgi:ankyrin repeat protein